MPKKERVIPPQVQLARLRKDYGALRAMGHKGNLVQAEERAELKAREALGVQSDARIALLEQGTVAPPPPAKAVPRPPSQRRKKSLLVLEDIESTLSEGELDSIFSQLNQAQTRRDARRHSMRNLAGSRKT